MQIKPAELALNWLGTPYIHQASCKGAGCDCLGLIRGVWREIYGAEPVSVPQYQPDQDEWQSQEVLYAELSRLCEKLDKPEVGCILLFRWQSNLPAKHLGVLVHEPSSNLPAKFIHSQNNIGVCEAWLDAKWQRRLIAQFAFPTVME